jgi:hypothetical protein
MFSILWVFDFFISTMGGGDRRRPICEGQAGLPVDLVMDAIV